MVRSESLKKAQKKYLAKIKEENSEVYQKIRQKHLEYQKEYLARMKEDDDKYNDYKKNRASYAKTFYDKNKENILEKRLKLREIKKNKELELLLKKEIS
tara:strand:+ start:267 stop:563 length:297 start_codon:yes stop_codon:yes gene_type:complete